MDLSILITYYPNRFEQLQRSLNSIFLQQFKPHQVELLLFNDGGQKEVISLLHSYARRMPIRHFSLEQKKLPIHHSCSRRNYLIRRAYGKYLLFSEPEMIHASSTINQAIRAFRLYGDKIWYCGRVYATNEVVTKSGKLRIFQKHSVNISLATMGPRPKTTVHLDVNFFKRNRRFYNITFANQTQFFFWCTALSKDNLIRVRGLNENLLMWGSEEIELFNRLKEIGVKKIYDSKFVSYHLPHPVMLSPEEKYIWGMYNNNVPFVNSNAWGYLPQEKIIETRL